MFTISCLLRKDDREKEEIFLLSRLLALRSKFSRSSLFSSVFQIYVYLASVADYKIFADLW